MMLGQLQENILVLLTYDEKHALLIRSLLEPKLFGSHYRTIVVRLYDYIDRFKKPPGDHIADLLEDKLDETNEEAELYSMAIQGIHAARRGINAEYVISQMETFIRRQNLRSSLVSLAKAVQKDTESGLDEAETIIAGISRVQLSVFDPGTQLSDKTRSLEFLDIQQTALATGVPELDRRGFGPTRKELWLFIGNTKAGKTWALIQLAKMALLHRVKVCHITLEMSETRCSQRYYQALFAIAKRKDPMQGVKFKRNQLGEMDGLDDIRLVPKMSYDDPNIRDKLEKKIDQWKLRMLDNIYIKQFPTGQLSVRQLTAYLDNLEAQQQFTPDLLIVDYPDLMSLDKDNYRLALDDLYKQLRGIAVSRNIALAVVSQSHRAAAKAKTVGGENVAEAYSKIAHADTIITYSRTKQEQKLGLARLHVAGGRNDQDQFSVAISQQYGLGSFVLDSCMMTGGYWKHIPEEDS